jgi:hypothetical protein
MIPPAGQVTATLLLAAFIFLIALAGLLVLLAVILLIRRHRTEKERDDAWERMQTVVHVPGTDKDHTHDNWEPGRNAFGFLTVLYSDDRSKIGQHFDLTQPCTTLGRSKDNLIHFPKDSPVSRHHAKIELKEDGVYLSEVMSMDGVRPRFGTFINQTRVVADPVRLKSGDQIAIGKRLQVKFQSLVHHPSNDEKTYAAFGSHQADGDKTAVQQEPHRPAQPATRDTDT